jgi:hypothetical protein
MAGGPPTLKRLYWLMLAWAGALIALAASIALLLWMMLR